MNIFSTLFAAATTFFVGTVSLGASVVTEPVCVVKPKVILRKGPGLKFAATWTVPKYMPFLRLERKSGWARVQDFEGEIHWAPPSSLSRKINCAVIKSKTARLRQGPGLDQPIADLATVDRYMAFQKVDRDGEWIQVRDEYGARYWVNEKNVWLPVTRTSVQF